MREQFVVTLTHDMRNPLNIARASAHILMRRGDDAQIRHAAVARLNSAIDHAERMIRDLLDTDQIRSGSPLKLEISEFDLCEFARDLLAEATMVHGDRFRLSCEPAIVGYWDRTNLTRLFWNILDNAVKYGWQHTKIGVTIKTQPDGVQIEINNKGPAVPADELIRLFDPYYRSSSAQGSHQTGWGLGLPLVRGIVGAHGGKIHARSNNEEGTTFSVTLPRDSRTQHVQPSPR